MDQPAAIPAGGLILAAWLLTVLVHSTVLLGGAWLAQRARLLRAPIWRDVVWKVALVGALVTATAQTAFGGGPVFGEFHLPSPPPSVHATAPSAWAPAGDDGVYVFRSASIEAPAPTPRDRVRAVAAPALALFTAGWVAFALFRLGRFGVRHVRLARYLRRRAPVRDARALELLDALVRRSGFPGRVRLSMLDGLAGPIALWRNEICVPARALRQLSPEELEAALAHELAHLARRDPEWLFVGGLVESALVFQPLAGRARHELRETAEFLCDDWAVNATGGGVTLARCLAAVASWNAPGRTTRLVAAMAEEKSSLVRRVHRLLDDDTSRATSLALRRRAAAMIAMLAGVAVLVPGFAARPPAHVMHPAYALLEDPSPALEGTHPGAGRFAFFHADAGVPDEGVVAPGGNAPRRDDVRRQPGDRAFQPAEPAPAPPVAEPPGIRFRDDSGDVRAPRRLTWVPRSSDEVPAPPAEPMMLTVVREGDAMAVAVRVFAAREPAALRDEILRGAAREMRARVRMLRDRQRAISFQGRERAVSQKAEAMTLDEMRVFLEKLERMEADRARALQELEQRLIATDAMLLRFFPAEEPVIVKS